MINVGISGVGSCLPETVVKNVDLESLMDTSDEWITTRTGIKERRVSTKSESLPILMAVAAKRALKDADCPVEDIDYVIGGTNSSDPLLVPHSTARVQYLIGAGEIPSCDIGAGCSGALYGGEFAVRTIRDRWAVESERLERLKKSKGLEKRGQIKSTKILVIGGDTLINVTPIAPTAERGVDRRSAVILADGAGAMVYEPEFDDDLGVKSLFCGADGSLGGLIHYGGGFGNQLARTNPATFVAENNSLDYFTMDGNAVHKLVIRKFPELIKNVVRGADLSLNILRKTVIVPHQMNLRTIDASVDRLQKEIGFEVKDVYREGVVKYGNTSTASTIIGLDEMQRGGRLDLYDPVIGVVFGAGMTWGAFLTIWGKQKSSGNLGYDVSEQREMVGELNEKYDSWKNTLAR